MTIWLDGQLPPSLAVWLNANFAIDAVAIRDLGLAAALDKEIFSAARLANVVVMTKDADFVEMQTRLGAPPQLIWLTCGNTSNARLQMILKRTLSDAIKLLNSGAVIVEIEDSPPTQAGPLSHHHRPADAPES